MTPSSPLSFRPDSVSARHQISTTFRFISAFFLALALSQGHADVPVLMFHNDVARTGVNTNETVLKLANVNTATFGLLGTHAVDDWVYAMPLVMTNVAVPGQGQHNLVLVATVNDTVYAFDADDPLVASPYWVTSFLGPNVVAVKNTDMTGACGGNYQDFHGNMGIVGTPVIDPSTQTYYVVAKTKENGSVFVQRLHALDIATGAERPGSPVVISASYAGTGDGSVSGVLHFDPMKENQRPALALVNGVVYIGWASHCDWGPYHGWLIGYNATNLTQTAVYNTTPNGGLGGIWSSGDAPAADDAGNLYFETGNGTFAPANKNYGDSFLKVSTTNGLALTDYFTPYNQSSLNSADLDIGSGGLMVLPDSVGSATHPRLLVGGSKAGTVYLLDRDNLGKFNSAGDTQIVQSVPNATGQCYDTPVYFNNVLYMAGTGDHLKAFGITNAHINPTPLSQSPGTFGFSAPTAALSANGSTDAIVWALQVDGWGSGQPAVLHAYNATNLAQELYNSSQAGTRDTAGGAVKFTVPVVANGKVYVGGQYALSVYGNAAGFVANPTITPGGGVFTGTVTVSLACATAGASIHYTTDDTQPTTDSPVYVTPLQITNSLAIKAKAFKAGYAASGVSTATFLNSTSVGTGTGLLGQYYSNHYPNAPYTNTPTLTRVDPTINFNWGSGSPDASISVDHFTARWTGTVQPQFSETYTFYTTTDDGVRLWVNGQQIINHWQDQGPTEWSGSIALAAGKRYTIEMDYYENGGGAVATLSWSSPTTAKALIPTSQLYSTTNPPPSVAILNPAPGTAYTASASVSIAANASPAGSSTISRVEFYSGTTYLGNVTNSPFTLTATGLAAGTYALTAVAYDDSGLSATSAPVSITVNPGSGLPYGLASRMTTPAYFGMPTTFNGAIPMRLSATGLFADAATLTPAASLIPYTVNVPLWSDAALKTRWMAVPTTGGSITPGGQVSFAASGEWSFPKGTVFVKHFELVTDETNPSKKRRLETRLLVMDSMGSAYGVTYKWRADNSDADLVALGQNEDILITTASGVRTQTWYYPSPADCMACHTPAANYVLGVKTRQLNGNASYSNGVTDNQLRTLNHIGLFYPAFDEALIPGFTKLSALTNLSASLEDRARSYLDANCAQCHRPLGPGITFDARYDTPLTNQNIVNVTPQKGDLGADNAHIVTPKDVWRSVLYGRMNTVDPTVRMPELARNLIDSTAVQVLGDWINSLPGTPALAPPIIVPGGGLFDGPVSVSLQSPDAGATLRYTLDTSLPTDSSTPYSGPLVLTNSVTLSVSAFEAGFNNSVATRALFVVNGPPFFSADGYFSNGVFQLPLSGVIGKTYILEATTDFETWTPVNTNVAPASAFNLMDFGATNFPLRFYRVIEAP